MKDYKSEEKQEMAKYSPYYDQGSGWQELKIDDLPSDIITGDYEIRDAGKKPFKQTMDKLIRYEILRLTDDRYLGYEYRKRQAKTASHEEIIKDVKDSAKFNEDGFRAVVIEALCFILESTPEAK